MTLKELKDEVNKIPSKLDRKDIGLCGDFFENIERNFAIDWMDCSDGILFFLYEE